MITVATLADQSQPTQDLDFTYYVQNDKWGTGYKRWAGQATAPDYPEWHTNPKQLYSYYSGLGIRNAFDDAPMMFDNQASDGTYRTGVALVGALRGAPGDAIYELRLSRVEYHTQPVPTLGESTFFKIVPEPAGTLWVAFTAVFVGLRRRRC